MTIEKFIYQSGDFGSAMCHPADGYDKDRKHVNPHAAALIICALLPGKWKVDAPRIDDCAPTNPPYRATAEGPGGAKLFFSPETNYGKSFGLRVSMGTFKTSQGETIDTTWIAKGGPKPCATVDLSKRSAKAIAKDINRRVVQPMSALLPAIHEKVVETDKRFAARDRLVARLEEVEGACTYGQVRPNDYEVSMRVGPLVVRVSASGSVSVDRGYLSEAQVLAVAKALSKISS